MRRFTGTWVAKAILGLMALSFGVFFGIGDMTRQIGMKNHVAIVGGEKIGIKEFQRAQYQEGERISQMLGKRLTSEELKSFELDKRVLKKLINQTLIDLETRKMNIVISDDRVREEIYKQKWFKNKDGLFDREMFLRFIQSQGYTEKEFADSTRRDIATRLLFGSIVNGVKMHSSFVDAVYEYQTRPREVKVIKIPFTSVSVPSLNDQELETFYVQHKEEFVKPEYRKIVYYVLSKDHLDKSRAIEDQLAAGKSLKEIYKDFALPVKTIDFVSKAGLGQDEKKVTGITEDTAFLDVAFTTQDQSDSMLFELANGDWCALHIETTLPSRIPSFEEIKPNVIARSKFDQQKKQVEKIAREVVEALKAKQETFENFAKKNKQDVVTYKNIVRIGEDEKKEPFSRPILSRIFTIKYGGFGFVVGEDHVLIASVTKPLAIDEEKKKKQFEAFSDGLANFVGNDIIFAYLTNLEKFYGVEIVSK